MIEIWENGVVLSFDLDTNLLKLYYSSTSPQTAYTDIKKFLVNNKFEHKRDSDYVNPNINKIGTVELIRNFSKNNKWFPICVNKINISPNIQSLDISSDIIKLVDEEWKNKKAIENGKNIYTDKKHLY